MVTITDYNSSKFKIIDVQDLVKYENKTYEQTLVVELENNEISLMDSLVELGKEDIGKVYAMKVEVNILNPEKNNQFDLPIFRFTKISDDHVKINNTVFLVQQNDLSNYTKDTFEAKVLGFIYRGLIKD